MEQRPDLLILRFDAQLYFANVNFFKDTLAELVQRKGKALKAVIINGESINNIDSSAAHALEEVTDDLHRQGIGLLFTGVKGPVRDAMARAHLTEKIGEENFYLSIQHAVEAVDQPVGEDHRSYVLQTNG